MKRSFFLLTVVFLSSLFMISLCAPDSDCEIYNKGSVKVSNNSSNYMVVKMISGSDFTSEMTIGPGSYSTSYEVPAGDLQVLSRPVSQANGWVSTWITVYACKTTDFEVK